MNEANLSTSVVSDSHLSPPEKQSNIAQGLFKLSKPPYKHS